MFEDLIEKKLVQKKMYPNGLSIFKYTRRVFYDALWNEDKRLLDARGMVLNAEGNKVIWPFTKIFNRGENNTDVHRDNVVVAADKINGFMACARWYKGELLVSTTGTLDSDFVALARKHIENKLSEAQWASLHNWTLMFEIVDESDPHIIEEETGAYLIGMRHMGDGSMASETFLDWAAKRYNFKRPTWCIEKFSSTVERMKTYQREGCVVRDITSGVLLLKIKTPHYLTKKFIMRAGKNKVENMFKDVETFKQFVDEEFYGVIDFIVENHSQEYWLALNDQERRETIEGFFNDYY